jgi:triosephosphate isomerase
MRKKIVAGNWKMNTSPREGVALAEQIRNRLAGEQPACRIIIIPPFTHLPLVHEAIKGSAMELGAQDCSEHSNGAWTGEISVDMIRECGARYVIVGHSERRKHFAEGKRVLGTKAARVIEGALKPIYCVGESLGERQNGSHFSVIEQQLNEVFFGNWTEEQLQHFVIAYEPVWAIGTGQTATPGQAQEMHAFIRELIRKNKGSRISDHMPILYGGSCNASNAAQLFSQPDIDGGLIGGASLKADDFLRIINAAS